MSEKYVVWLSSEHEWNDAINAYGYWSGKSYRKDYQFFPIADRRITDRTKVYASRKRAENALEAALNKFEYAMRGRVEPYKED